MLMLPTTLRALSHHGARYLPLSVRLVGRRTVGIPPHHGAVRVGVAAGSQLCQFTRRMSTSPTKHLFFVHAPDYVSPGMLDHRFSVREKHLKGVDGLIESGIVSACDVRLLWGVPRPIGSLY